MENSEIIQKNYIKDFIAIDEAVKAFERQRLVTVRLYFQEKYPALIEGNIIAYREYKSYPIEFGLVKEVEINQHRSDTKGKNVIEQDFYISVIIVSIVGGGLSKRYGRDLWNKDMATLICRMSEFESLAEQHGVSKKLNIVNVSKLATILDYAKGGIKLGTGRFVITDLQDDLIEVGGGELIPNPNGAKERFYLLGEPHPETPLAGCCWMDDVEEATVFTSKQEAVDFLEKYKNEYGGDTAEVVELSELK